jgi:UDP-glucose 4-epimerase
MNILITGACGHIGSYLSHNINKIHKIKKVILVDNLKSNRYNSIFNLPKKIKISFFERDLNFKDSLNDFKNIDCIIHCASMTNAEKSFGKQKEMYSNNLNCMKTVIDYCIRTNAKLIHISSTSVYGKKDGIVNEDNKSHLNPQSPYADIKIKEEEMLKRNSKKLRYTTFRFGTIAGVSEGIRFHTAVNKFCFNAAHNLKIHVYKTAYNQFRPYLSLRDSFKVFKFCLEKNFFKNDIYNALTGNFTVHQIINKIKKYKKNVKVKFVKSAIMNQLSYHVDNSKLKNEGLILKSDIKKDIDEILKLF